MDGDREGSLDRIVGEALQRSQAERSAYLESACGGSHALAIQAQQILRDLDSLGSFLEPRQREHGPAPIEIDGSGILLPGECLAGHRIESLHARGGSSEVYVAIREDESREQVALKVWRLTDSRPSPGLAKVQHPNLVKILDSGTDEERGLAFHSMALVPGPSMERVLEDRIDSGRAANSKEEVLLIERFLEVADALAELHGQGLRHGDVKPANMVFDCQPEDAPLRHPVIVVDLGLVRANTPETSLATVYATFAYAAPEVLLGLSQDARSDVFSLGVSMHDLLCARFPWQRERRQTQGLETLTQVLPQCDPDLAAIVAEATALDPSHRYVNAAAMATDLRAWLKGEQVSVRPRRLIARQRRRLQRSPRPGLVLSGLALLLTLGLLLLGAGVLWISDAIGKLSRLQESLVAGDLETYAQQRASLSPLLSGMAAEPSTEELESFDQVLERINQGDVPGAKLHAGRLLGRDGLDAYPELLAWFENRMLHGDRGDALETTTVLSRLLLDHPVQSPKEHASLEAITDTLVAALHLSRPLATRLHAISALGGSALLPAISPILTHLEESAERTTEAIELYRVSMVALQRITQRAARMTPDLIMAQDWESLVTSAVKALEIILPDASRHASALTAPLDLWTAVMTISLQDAKLELRARALMQGLPPMLERTRAANRDPALLNELRTGSYMKATEVLKDGVFQGSWAYHHLGSFLGHYPVSEQMAFINYLETQTQAQHLETREWRPIFDKGVAEARQLRAGQSNVWETYPESHLGRWFKAVEHDFVAMDHRVMAGYPSKSSSQAGEALMICWDFSPGELEVYGPPGSVENRVAPITPDNYIQDQSYLLFSVPGVSTLRLRFPGRPRSSQLLRLRIELQKGLRQALPYSGTCGLDLSLNGELRTTLPNMVEGSLQEIILPLGRITGTQEQVLELQLSGASNTSLRILSVGILEH